MKYLFSILFISVLTVWGQEKEVTLTTTGTGQTQNDAKEKALRNAIEQAFGAFISSRTEILNDELISDQITSLTSGNIKSYEILNEAQIPSGGYASTVKATVSVDKLINFVEAKGVKVEFKGNLFALNIKQQVLNENAEFNIVYNMCGMLYEVMQTAFDFSILSNEPKSTDGTSNNWVIPIVIQATANENMNFCSDYLFKTLTTLSLSSQELINYKTSGKDYWSIKISFNGKTEIITLRKSSSLNVLISLFNGIQGFTRMYKIDAGSDQQTLLLKYNSEKSKLKSYFSDVKSNAYSSNYKYDFNLFSKGEVVAQYAFDHYLSLAQIENMNGYNVAPIGIQFKINNGGFIIPDISSRYLIGVGMNNNIINSVEYNTPAQMAGLEVGDKIIKINDKPFKNQQDFIEAKTNGNSITLEVLKESSGDYENLIIVPQLMPSIKGLVVSLTDYDYELSYDEANIISKDCSYGGFKDWRLPTIDELRIINSILFQNSIGGLNGEYWSVTEEPSTLEDDAWFYRFYKSYKRETGGYYLNPDRVDKRAPASVRLVRTINQE